MQRRRVHANDENPSIQLTNEQVEAVVPEPEPVNEELAMRQAQTITSIQAEVNQCIDNVHMHIASAPDILITTNIVDKSVRFPIRDRGNLTVTFKAKFKPN